MSLPRLLALTCIWLATSATPALAQGDVAQTRMEGAWRMVPMDPNMIMLPGLEGVVPVVGAFEPGVGIDLATLPEARPSEVVAMQDGDTLDIAVSMVRRTIGGHEMVMFGYNGQ